MAKRRPLTPEEKANAERAKSLWVKKKREEKISQSDAAADLGMTPSGFNQYINGKIPLNTDATLLLANYFGVNPHSIDPGWLDSAMEATYKREPKPAFIPGTISAEIFETPPGEKLIQKIDFLASTGLTTEEIGDYLLVSLDALLQTRPKKRSQLANRVKDAASSVE